MYITSKSETAIGLLVFHAGRGRPLEPISTKEAAAALGTSADYLRYVSRILSYRGYLIAIKGRGFYLGRNPAEIPIACVLKITQRRTIEYGLVIQDMPKSIFSQFLEEKMGTGTMYFSYALSDLVSDWIAPLSPDR